MGESQKMHKNVGASPPCISHVFPSFHQTKKMFQVPPSFVVVRRFVLRLLPVLLFLADSVEGIPPAPIGFALIEHMNRFSTADKLNRSRPAVAATKNAPTSAGAPQSYKDQLMSVILQNAANTSFSHPPSSAEHLLHQLDSSSSAANSQPIQPHFEEQPNGNMKSKDFGNGEGELDMLFGFFVMNGACIVFFLLFGVCVICNCAARKPKFHGSEQKEKKRKKPTVSRLVAAMAPPGFGRAKANVAAKQEQQNGAMANSTNIPLLQANSMGSRRGSTASIRLDQNGNGGAGGGGGPLIANHSPSQRSFRSLVAKAVASAKSLEPMSGGSLAVNIESDADSQLEPESQQPQNQQRERAMRRQSRDAPIHYQQQSQQQPHSPSGGNSPARRMSALSSAIEESSRRISKMSHCSANECCSLHVLEVPVEVEVHHCPSPTGGGIGGGPPSPSFFPDFVASLGAAHHPKLGGTQSMPLDLARATKLQQQQGMAAMDPPQQICLTEHGQFIVRRETIGHQSGASGGTTTNLWRAGPLRHSFRSSRHRCSLVVPLQIPCGECRVQIEPEREEEEGEIEGENGGQEGGNDRRKMEGNDDEDGRMLRPSKSEEEADKMMMDQEEEGGGGGSRKASASGEFSVVRQNLLGPLSFDDLYYIT